MKRDIRDRIRGSIFGGAAGDALGYAVEFDRLRTIRKEYGTQGITSYTLYGLTGEAVFSDDTQMTLFTATGLLTAETARAQGLKRKKTTGYIHDAYIDWYTTQTGSKSRNRNIKNAPESWLLEVRGLHERRAPGITCLNALGSAKSRSLYNPINNSKGCGSIMRLAPVGLMYPDAALEEIAELAAEASAITHGHPLGCFPSSIFACIVQQAVYGDEGTDLAGMTERAVSATRNLYGKSDLWDDMESLVGRTLECAANNESDDVNIKSLGEGWVAEEALAVALYCALRYENDLSAGLIASVNHDGDSDSTGAIAGNILGALHGYDSLDRKWLDDLELKDVLMEVADDIYLGTDIEGNGLCSSKEWLRKYGSASDVKGE